MIFANFFLSNIYVLKTQPYFGQIELDRTETKVRKDIRNLLSDETNRVNNLTWTEKLQEDPKIKEKTIGRNQPQGRRADRSTSITTEEDIEAKIGEVLDDQEQQHLQP